MRKLRLLLIVPVVFLLNISSLNAIQVSLSDDKLEQYFRILELYVLPFLVVATIVLLCGYIVSRIFNRRQRRLAEEVGNHAPKATPEEGTAAFLRELKSKPPIKDPEIPDTQRLAMPRNRNIGQEFREPKFSIGPSGRQRRDDHDGTGSPLLLQVASAVGASRSPAAEAAGEDSPGAERLFPAAGRWDDPARSGMSAGDEATGSTDTSEISIPSASLVQEALGDEDQYESTDAPLAEDDFPPADETPLDLGAPLIATSPAREESDGVVDLEVASESFDEIDTPIADEGPFESDSAAAPAVGTKFSTDKEFGNGDKIEDADEALPEEGFPLVDDIPSVAEPPWLDELPSLSDRPFVAEAPVGDDGLTSVEPPLVPEEGTDSWTEGISGAAASSAAPAVESASDSEAVDEAGDEAGNADEATIGDAEEPISLDGPLPEAPEIVDDEAPVVIAGGTASKEETFRGEDRTASIPIFPAPPTSSHDAGVVHPLTGSAEQPSMDGARAYEAAGEVISDTNRVTAKLQASAGMLAGFGKAGSGLSLDDVRDLRISDFALSASLAADLESMGEGVVDDVLNGYATVDHFNHVVDRLEQMAASEPLDEGWTDLIVARLSETLADLENVRNTLSSIVPTEPGEMDEGDPDPTIDTSSSSERSSSHRGFPFGRKRG